MLYVPTLPESATSVCADAEYLIPENATTLSNFPANQDYPLVAIFPWSASVDCTQAFLAQARADAVRAAMAFQPNTGGPPAPTDPSWYLNDGGRWKSDNQYPIYAIAAPTGANLLHELTLYSGNMSSAPNGNILGDQYDERDFPRLFAHVTLQGGANVPSLWIFLIIVLAVLLGIVVVASVVMHFIQRHQRRTLQRRLERGEVDLESIGIKKMNVPQQKIDEMPKYTYTESLEMPSPAVSKPVFGSSPQTQVASFSQPTCPICLDDFISNETQVRELPCKHIFHPECIDIFLRDNSSLCPMCKKSALPAGYCPVKVTNLMVRRERLVRRMRERRRQSLAIAAARAAGEPIPRSILGSQALLWIKRALRIGEGTPSQPPPSMAEASARRWPSSTADNSVGATNAVNNDVELGPTNNVNPSVAPDRRMSSNFLNARRQTIAVPSDIAAQGAAARRAWRRERLARQQEEQYNEQAETARQADVGRPLWKRIAGRFIPGIN